jgi:hypothetical protein
VVGNPQPVKIVAQLHEIAVIAGHKKAGDITQLPWDGAEHASVVVGGVCHDPCFR